MSCVITEAGSHIVPACPWWCEAPADHDMDNPLARDNDGAVNRCHETRAVVVPSIDGDFAVRVAAGELVPAQGRAEVPCVLIEGSPGSLFTAAQAETFAAVLVAAASRLREIERGPLRLLT